MTNNAMTAIGVTIMALIARPTYAEVVQKHPCRPGADAIPKFVDADRRGANVGDCVTGTVHISAQASTPITRGHAAASGKAFFMYFPTSGGKEAQDRLVVWMMGGPGCSTMPAPFEWNGPFLWDPKAPGSSPFSRPACLAANGALADVCSNLSSLPDLVPNPHSWHRHANVLYIEQPLGTGMSTLDSQAPIGSPTYQDGLYVSSSQVGVEMRELLSQFVNARVAEDQHGHMPSQVFLAGPSYGGHYLPAIGAALLRKPIDGLKLGGIAVGNGLVDAGFQFPAYVDYAEWLIDNGESLSCPAVLPDGSGKSEELVPLLTAEMREKLRSNVAAMRAALGSTDSLETLLGKCRTNPRAQVAGGINICTNILIAALGVPSTSGAPLFGGGLPVALGQQIGVDFQIMNVCPGNSPAGGEVGYNFQYTLTLLRDAETLEKLGVPQHQPVQDRSGKTAPYQLQFCDMNVRNKFDPADIYAPMEEYLRFLLDSDVPVLVYSGDIDYNCNWIGGWAWTQSQPWKHQAAFSRSRDDLQNSPIKTDSGKLLGWLHNKENFAFLRVSGAGHLVPLDQPETSSFMLEKFLDGSIFRPAASASNKTASAGCSADSDCQVEGQRCVDGLCFTGGCRLQNEGTCSKQGADYCNLDNGKCESFLKLRCTSDDTCGVALAMGQPDPKSYQCVSGYCKEARRSVIV